jgi:hypothetical protein
MVESATKPSWSDRASMVNQTMRVGVGCSQIDEWMIFENNFVYTRVAP